MLSIFAVVVSPDDPGFWQSLFDAVVAGNWWVVAALAVGFLTWVTQALLGKKWEFFKGALWTLVIGAIYAFLGAFITTYAALGIGAPLTWPIIKTVLLNVAVSTPFKMLMQALLALVIAKLGFTAKADAEQLQAQAKAAGLKAANSVTTESAKDFINKGQ